MNSTTTGPMNTPAPNFMCFAYEYSRSAQCWQVKATPINHISPGKNVFYTQNCRPGFAMAIGLLIADDTEGPQNVNARAALLNELLRAIRSPRRVDTSGSLPLITL